MLHFALELPRIMLLRIIGRGIADQELELRAARGREANIVDGLNGR